MKYKFQHMHSWRSVAQRSEHWQTMPEVPGSNPARSPQLINYSDQTKDGAVAELEEQTREMMEQWNQRGVTDRSRPERRWNWNGWADQGWSISIAEELEPGTADLMEEHAADRVEDKAKVTKESDDSTWNLKKGGDRDCGPPPGLQDNEQPRLWTFFLQNNGSPQNLLNKCKFVPWIWLTPLKQDRPFSHLTRNSLPDNVQTHFLYLNLA